MIVQWCIKGIALTSDAEARGIIDEHRGLVSSWWRRVGTISPPQRRGKLTPSSLDMHVNHFERTDPSTGRPFREDSPFISLSCGTIERNAAAQTNQVHRALRTALLFGTEFGRNNAAYLYTCWVVLAPRPSVEVEGLAEEIRDLNAYRRYSSFQTEGEVAAKVNVPVNHIHDCTKWAYDRASRKLTKEWEHLNPAFTPPETLTNVRELI